MPAARAASLPPAWEGFGLPKNPDGLAHPATTHADDSLRSSVMSYQSKEVATGCGNVEHSVLQLQDGNISTRRRASKFSPLLRCGDPCRRSDGFQLGRLLRGRVQRNGALGEPRALGGAQIFRIYLRHVLRLPHRYAVLGGKYPGYGCSDCAPLRWIVEQFLVCDFIRSVLKSDVPKGAS